MRGAVDDEAHPGEAAGHARLRAHLTVRARILTAVVALSALTVVIAGGTAFALQVREMDARINGSLANSIPALQKAVEEALYPESAAAPTGDEVPPPEGMPAPLPASITLSDLLWDAVSSRVPGRNEGVMTMLDGAPLWQAAPETHPVRINLDEDLVRQLAALPPDVAPEPMTFTTPTTTYRVVVAPLTVPGDESRGLFVAAFDRDAEMRILWSTYRTYLEVGLGALAVIACVAWFVVGRLLRPVRMLRDTARRITESDLSERIAATGNDDLSDLARTVNAMLDRLQRAFGSQRELLDDVGHELRTPLTIVRGHLELMDAEDPDDVRATQALTLDELDRMHRLVDSLVTLATADRPDFVRLAPVDVGRLTDDVHDKARGLGDRRWLVTARADVTAELDAQRITQAWLQLLANAHRFSAPGSTVRLGSEVADGRLLLWVRDEGPGVPASEEARIFERFHRGLADRTAHGAGLGLPIVAAIAQAHHGRVFLEHPPAGAGPGVVFVLDLPAVGLADGDTRPAPELVENR